MPLAREVDFIPEIHGGDNFDAWFKDLMTTIPCSLVPCPDPSCHHGLSDFEDADESPADTLADCEL